MLDFTHASDKPYQIIAKRDFPKSGFLVNGRWIKSGYIVVRGGVNIMPGATWFKTIEEAARAVVIHQGCKSADEFWSKLRPAKARPA